MSGRVAIALLFCVASVAIGCAALLPANQVVGGGSSGTSLPGRTAWEDPGAYVYGWIPTFAALAVGLGMLATGRGRRRWSLLAAVLLGQLGLHAGILWFTGELDRGGFDVWHWEYRYHLPLSVLAAVSYVAIATLRPRASERHVVRPPRRPPTPPPAAPSGAPPTRTAGVI